MAEQEGMAAWTASAGLSAPHRATADERTRNRRKPAQPSLMGREGGRDKVAGAAEDVASFISNRRLSTSGRD